jgi:hypothetical protein
VNGKRQLRDCGNERSDELSKRASPANSHPLNAVQEENRHADVPDGNEGFVRCRCDLSEMANGEACCLGYIIPTNYDKSIPTAQVRRTIKLPTYIYCISNYPQSSCAKSKAMFSKLSQDHMPSTW